MAGALIGALRVSLSAETSAFEAGMKKSQKQAATTASSIQGSFNKAGSAIKQNFFGINSFLSALSIGMLTQGVRASLEYAGSLGEVAAQLGVTTKELQNFRAVAMQSGASMEEADSALGKLSLNMSKAQSGSEKAAKAFGSVGVSISDMTTKSRWEVIGQIADQMNRQGGAAKNAAAGVAIFGKGFQKIIPTLDQGSAGINALADANERLGGVLSAKEIQEADKTADKIGQLMLVLKTKIASDVAANSNAIGEFASFLFNLVNAATQARQALADFGRTYFAFRKSEFGFDNPGRSVTTRLGQGGTADAEARRRGLKLMSDVPPAPSGAPPQFLASGGGGGKPKKDRSAEEAQRRAERALRENNQFDQEIRRAKIDVLNATRDLATDEVERYQISVDIKDAEKSAFEAQLRYEVALNTLTKGEEGRTQVQADQLQLEYDRRDQLERDKLIADESARARESIAKLNEVDFDLARERLQSEAQLAETASEQRDVQLRLLDLFYRQERARLEAILADEQSSELAKEEARRRLINLNKTEPTDRAGVVAGTRGPLEDYMSELPSTTEKWNEALENVAANGLRSVEDGIVDILTGAKTVGEALQDILGDIIKQLIRIAVQKMIVQVVGGGMGGFATGGFVSGPGTATSDSIPAMLSNGEFVMNTGAVRSFGPPFFDAINTGQLTPEMLAEKGGGGGGMGFLKFLSPAAFLASSAKKGGVGGFLKALSPLALLGGKIFGFSEGGLVGRGLTVPRTSFPHVPISNDNLAQPRNGDSYHFSFPGVTNAREARQSGLQAANAFRGAVARSSRVNS